MDQDNPKSPEDEGLTMCLHCDLLHSDDEPCPSCACKVCGCAACVCEDIATPEAIRAQAETLASGMSLVNMLDLDQREQHTWIEALQGNTLLEEAVLGYIQLRHANRKLEHQAAVFRRQLQALRNSVGARCAEAMASGQYERCVKALATSAALADKLETRNP